MGTTTKSTTAVILTAAISVGLMVGGGMLVLVTTMSPKFPAGMRTCGIVQVALGFVGILGATLLWRGSWVGKLVLLLVIIGVLTNFGVYVMIGITWHLNR
jgi:hypothetical protein